MRKNEQLIDEKAAVSTATGEHIGYELGAKMIKDHYDKFQMPGAQFVGRNILEQILAQPGCIGIKVYNALNEKGERTYVMTGADANGKDILTITAVSPVGLLEKSEGIVADRAIGGGWYDYGA
jgi:hypothetical protein